MSFDPWNTFLNIWDSIGILIPKVGVHLGVCEFILTHSRECKYDSRVALLAHTFPCICFGHKPKAKVVTSWAQQVFIVWRHSLCDWFSLVRPSVMLLFLHNGFDRCQLRMESWFGDKWYNFGTQKLNIFPIVIALVMLLFIIFLGRS
jgi:hypothetical protein